MSLGPGHLVQGKPKLQNLVELWLNIYMVIRVHTLEIYILRLLQCLLLDIAKQYCKHLRRDMPQK
jgi:hypothetical protein